jgi:membrane protein implicated in regulation of membrane protease activity
MNRAFLIVGIPAVVTSFCWLAFGWGWRVAAAVTGSEIVAITAFVIWVLRRRGQPQRSSQQESSH